MTQNSAVPIVRSMEGADQFRIPTATDIERRAKAMGLSIPDLCKRADISASTFYRWLAGESVIKVDVANRLLEVVQPSPTD